MANFAVLSGSTVENVIVCDTQELAEQITGKTCIEYTSENPVGIGDTYDEAGDIFVAPPAPPIEDAAPAEPIIEEPPIEDPAPAE